MPEQVEQIVLEAEEASVLEAVAKANAALDTFEKAGTRAGGNVGQSFQKSGETIIRAMDRSRASAERLVASIEKRAALAGKSGVERLIAERDQLVQRLAGEERAVERAKAAFDKLITAQRQVENSSRSFGTSIQNFVGAPLQTMGTAVQGLAARLGAGGVVGLGLVAGLAAATKAAVSFVHQIGAGADQMANMAERTGLSVNQVDRLQAMAKLADVHLESLETGARTLAEGLADFGGSGDRAREALRRLNVQVYDSSGNQREMGRVLLDVLHQLGGVENQAERVSLATATLGRGALALLPLIRNYEALEREAKRLGFGMDEYVLKRLGAASDEVDKLGLRWELLKRKLAVPAMAVVEVVTRVVEAVAGPRERKPFEVTNPDVAAGLERQGVRVPGGPLAGAFSWIREQAGLREQQERAEGAAVSERFLRRRAATVEGMRARIQALEEEQRPLEAALRSKQLTGDAAREKQAQFEALEREKADLNARIKALEEARQHAEHQAKRAEKARGELEHFKYLVGLAASGGQVGPIVLPDKELTAVGERAAQFHIQRFQTSLQAESAGLEEEVRNIEKSLQRLKQVDEQKVAGLAREARMNEQLIRLRTGPGGEAQAIEKTYGLRLEYAQREFDIHQDRARFEEALQEAEIDRITQIAELEKRRFDSLMQSAEGIFDALLTRSQSLGSAILNIFKTAVLTPVKQAFSTMIAGILMPAYGMGGSAGAGGLRALLGLGGLVGAGTTPSFGGFGLPGAPGGTVGFAGPVAVGGSPARTGVPWASLGATGANYLAGLKSFAGIGGSVQLGPGMATTWQAATLGQKLSAIGHSNAALLGGGLLAYAGLRRGGLSGLAMTTAGGALIGFKFGGPLGAAIGAGAGAVAGFVRLFMKGAEEKLRDKVRAVYGVEMHDKGILRQILDTAKQGFGGNFDVAIRSPQIRDLIELYAMTTGQRMTGMPASARPVSLIQSGGTLYQAPSYSNGSLLPSFGGLPTMGVTPQSAGPQPIVVKLDGPATTSLLRGEAVQAMADNPRVVQTATLKATRANSGRRELLSLQLSPGTLTS